MLIHYYVVKPRLNITTNTHTSDNNINSNDNNTQNVSINGIKADLPVNSKVIIVYICLLSIYMKNLS